jgi:hypothetical protein
MDSSLRAGIEHLVEYLLDKLVRLIEDCVPLNTSETPPYWSSPETEYSPEGPIWEGQHLSLERLVCQKGELGFGSYQCNLIKTRQCLIKIGAER